MSDENQELNDSEMDDLLRELEKKADSAVKKESPTKTEIKNKAPKKEKALPKSTPKQEMTKAKEPERNVPTGVSVVQRGADDSLQRKLSLLILAGVIPIILLAVWLLGNYLAAFISAGWLITLVAVFAVLGLSYLVKKLIRKGRYSLWAGLTSLLLCILMLLPSTISSERMIQYGHWPASTFSQALGWERDNSLVSFSQTIAHKIASALPLIGLSINDLTSSKGLIIGKDTPLQEEPKPEDNVDPKTEVEKKKGDPIEKKETVEVEKKETKPEKKEEP